MGATTARRGAQSTKRAAPPAWRQTRHRLAVTRDDDHLARRHKPRDHALRASVTLPLRTTTFGHSLPAAAAAELPS